jgi:hypothetical protein
MWFAEQKTTCWRSFRCSTAIRMSGFIFTLCCAVNEGLLLSNKRPNSSLRRCLMSAIFSTGTCMYLILTRFSSILGPGQAPAYRPDNYGISDLTLETAQVNDYKRLQLDRIFVAEMMPEFLMLGTSEVRPNLPIIDNFTDGLVEVFETKSISLWITFATQIYVDIHNALGANIKRALTEMRATGIRTSISIQ